MRMCIASLMLVATLPGCFGREISIGQGISIKRMGKIESDQKNAAVKLFERTEMLVAALTEVSEKGEVIPNSAIDAVAVFVGGVEQDQKERSKELYDDTFKNKKWSLTTIKAVGVHPAPELDSLEERTGLAVFEKKVQALDILMKIIPKITGSPLPKFLAGSGAPPPEIAHAGEEGSDSPMMALLGVVATMVPAGALFLKQHIKNKKQQVEGAAESARWKGGARAAVRALNRLKQNGDRDKVIAALEGDGIPEEEKAAGKQVYRDLKTSADV